MAVPYKAPVKDIVFGYEVIDSYSVLNKISAFSDFSEDIVIPTMEECAKFSEEILAPINSIGDQQGATIKDGVVTMPEEFVDAYKKFAIKAKSTGDTMGRKMIMSPVGAGNIDFDYVYSLYANSPSEYGKNVDNFGLNLRGTPEAEALNSISECGNGRSYTTVRVKEAK